MWFWTGLHLNILIFSLPELLEPEVALTGVDSGWWSDTCTLAVRSRGDGFHRVEVLLRGAAFFYPPTGAPAQGSDNTFTPTVRAFRQGFHFVIITKQLQRKKDGWVFLFSLSLPHSTRFNQTIYASMIPNTYLRDDAVLTFHLLMQIFTLLCTDFDLRARIWIQKLRGCRDPRGKPAAHHQNQQLQHFLKA